MILDQRTGNSLQQTYVTGGAGSSHSCIASYPLNPINGPNLFLSFAIDFSLDLSLSSTYLILLCSKTTSNRHKITLMRYLFLCTKYGYCTILQVARLVV